MERRLELDLRELLTFEPGGGLIRNRSRTAEQLDIGLATLYRKLKQYGHPEAPN
jgi:DNA-binding NtrC family response regulator